MVIAAWEAAPSTFSHVALGDFVLMPNHLHAIVHLLDVAPAERVALGAVIRWFKYRTTLEYGRGVRTGGWPRFEHRLWQRGFHDRVLRDEEEHAHARGYMARNPRQWREDRYHP